MTEKSWRRVTGWAGILVGLLAGYLLIEHLQWLFSPIMSSLGPFLLALFIAFLLNPLLVRLENKGLSRLMAVILTSTLFIAVFAAVVFLLVPQLVSQGADLARNMPQYARSLEKGVDHFLASQATILKRVSLPTSASELLRQFPDQIHIFSTSALTIVSRFVLSVASKVTWLVIVPLVTVWLLINWNSQCAAFYRLLPKAHKDRMIGIIDTIASVLNSYVRGAIVVAVLYGAVTALILALIFRMPYSLVLGLIAGLVSPIPYIGSMIIMLSTGIVAYAANPSAGYVIAVLIAMTLQNNVLFDNFIAPRILGGSVGLSLPWSILALMVGGSLMGITGMILAVPVGATIRVLMLELIPQLRNDQADDNQTPVDETSKPKSSHTT